MTQTQKDFNVRCAKFLGWDFFYDAGFCYEVTDHDGNKYETLYELKFHSDWNWLQEVKAKICSLEIVDEFEIKYDSVSKGFYGHISPSYKDSFEYFTTGTLAVGADAYPTEMEATIEIINQFLTWYETHV
jgi:hypothetical protein